MRLYLKIGRTIILPVFLMGLAWTAGAQSSPSAGHQGSDSVEVTGIILDATTGAPVTGINVSVPDYSAAITDEQGTFSLKAPSYHTRLEISGQDYQVKLVPLKGRHHITVKLYAEPYQSVYDQAVLPFGSKPKADISYAISQVNTDDKWERSSTETPGSYLQGSVAGLNVIRHSGTPAIGSALFLRGFKSLYTNRQPLIVVDGMIYDNTEYGQSLIDGHLYNPLSGIDIKDIDNITVIKGGTSTYGTRGANGVILITTARAKELATRIDFAAYGSYNMAPDALPVMDATDYRIYLSDVLQSGGFGADSVANLPYMNDTKNPDYYRYHYNTDWQKQVLKNSYNQNYYLKVTGGDNIAKYALSLGYLKSAGILKNTDMTRFQTRFNGDLNLSRHLTAAVNLALTSNQQNLQNEGLATGINPLSVSLAKAPFLPVHVVSDSGIVSPNLSDVDIFNLSNPAALIKNAQGANKNYRFTGSVKFRYEFNPSVALQTLLGVTFDKVQEDMFIPQAGVSPDTLTKAVAYNRSGSNVERLYTLYNDTRLSYNHTFNYVHHFSADVGFRFNHSKAEDEYGLDYNSATDEFVSVGMGLAALRNIGGSIGEWNWLNTYAHADYDYRHKYFLSANLAIDGSSRFGKKAPGGLTFAGNKMAVMPSVAAGWLLSSENFFSRIQGINLLKLRASYSHTGNDDIGDYSSRQYYLSQNLLGMEGLVKGNVANPALKWESVGQTDIGLDASLFNERINITLDGWFSRSSDMITMTPTMTASGFQYAVTNNSQMRTRGFEAAVSARIINRALTWDFGINLATYRNEVTDIPGGELLSSYAGATVLTRTGGAANLFYGYKSEGVFSSEQEAASAGLQYEGADGATHSFHGGDIRFKDVNNDHLINEADRQVIGNPNPKLTGGFTNTFGWKNWKLTALFTFSQGNDIYNYTRRQLESMSGFDNQTQAMVNRWRVDGQQTAYPRAAWGDPSGNARFSDRWIEDGSYLRLRTLSVSYNVPVKNSALKYVDLYATGNNLVTWTRYLGYDPEFSLSNSIFTQGIDLSLEPQFATLQLGIRLGF